MKKPSSKNNTTMAVAYCGVFAALSVFMMLLGNLLPMAGITAPALASLCIIPIMVHFGTKYAFLLYCAISLLSLFLSADLQISLLFIFLLGYAPVLHPHLQRIKLAPIRYLIITAIYCVAITIMYALLLFIIKDPATTLEVGEYSNWFSAGLFLIGLVTFHLYDKVVHLSYAAYKARFQKKRPTSN